MAPPPPPSRQGREAQGCRLRGCGPCSLAAAAPPLPPLRAPTHPPTPHSRECSTPGAPTPHPSCPLPPQGYLESLKEPFCIAERALLFALDFSFDVADPYPHVTRHLRALGLTDEADRAAKLEVQQLAWCFLRDRCGAPPVRAGPPSRVAFESLPRGAHGVDATQRRGGGAARGPVPRASPDQTHSPLAPTPPPNTHHRRSLSCTVSLTHPPEKIAAAVIFLSLLIYHRPVCLSAEAGAEEGEAPVSFCEVCNATDKELLGEAAAAGPRTPRAAAGAGASCGRRRRAASAP